MPQTNHDDSSARWRTGGTVVLAIIAAAGLLYFGRAFFVPIVFAVLLSITCRPIVRWLHRGLRVPESIAAAVVVIALIALLVAAGWCLVGPVQRWLNEAPERFTQSIKKFERFRRPMQQASDVAQKIEKATQAPTTAAAQPLVPKGPGLADRAFGNA